MSITDNSDKNIKISYNYIGKIKEYTSIIQNIKIANTVDFGNALFLDNCLQSTEKDEYIYHETIVHGLLSC